MHRVKLAVVTAAVMSLLATSLTLGARPQPPALANLDPGGTIELWQELPVNVVFVGYEEGGGDMDVNAEAFQEGLASTYDAINRFPAFYGLPADAHVSFTYDYNILFADEDFEDDFFGYLGDIAEPADLTLYQELYNDQENADLTVADNHFIDAPSVEQWLADNAGSELGIDTSEYTIFFVNWYSRPDDFIHHVYTKMDEPDPDTGYNFGELRETRKIIAWGGTAADDEESGLGSTHRIWFYDLSAGPEAWTDNWNVDDADLDGNGDTDYRMPPVWEYGTDGYRLFDDLSGDLAKVARFVALDLLFTTSPLYKPALSPPDLPNDIQLDINAFDNAGVDVAALFDLPLINDEIGELKPDVAISSELTIRDLGGKLERVYKCFASEFTNNPQSCYGNRLFGIAFADLFLYFTDHLLKFLEGDSDYELPIFAFYGAEDLEAGGLLGFADDNWADGTQSYVFAFDDPLLQELGYGFTTTTIHEAGHHLGMSHPHDGWDSEAGVDFSPADDFYFAWSGDESNTIMSYVDLNWDFSQFDRDNMNRYMTATYLNTANAVLKKIYRSPRAGRVSSLLLTADARAGEALAAYDAYDWAIAMLKAEAAYRKVMAAAARIGIPIEPQSWQADYKARGEAYAFVDPVHHHRDD